MEPLTAADGTVGETRHVDVFCAAGAKKTVTFNLLTSCGLVYFLAVGHRYFVERIPEEKPLIIPRLWRFEDAIAMTTMELQSESLRALALFLIL